MATPLRLPPRTLSVGARSRRAHHSRRRRQSAKKRRPHTARSAPHTAALLIGIEYTKYARQKRAERLPGCHADVRSVRSLLLKKFNFASRNIRILSDDGSHAEPTHSAIRNGLLWLGKQAQRGCRDLFLFYSGHGTQTIDRNHDDSDGHDEALVPSDYLDRKLFVDDRIGKILVGKLPNKCRLTAVIDACNSGTILDLPFVYKTEPVTQRVEKPASETKAQIVSISGCKDNQTSASAYALDRSQKWRGALTFCLEHLLSHAKQPLTCKELVDNVREELCKRGFCQRPQLCTSYAMDTSSVIFMK